MTPCAWSGHPTFRRGHADFCPTVDPSWMPFLSPLAHFPQVCSVDGCDRTHHAKGFCMAHYAKNYRLLKPGLADASVA